MNYAQKLKKLFLIQMARRKRKEIKNIEPNIKDDTPQSDSRELFNKKSAITKFIFKNNTATTYKRLTYDYLYNMAKDLHDKDQLMYMGAGTTGTDL